VILVGLETAAWAMVLILFLVVLSGLRMILFGRVVMYVVLGLDVNAPVPASICAITLFALPVSQQCLLWWPADAPVEVKCTSNDGTDPSVSS
jgi:hypothetical protein